MKNRWLKTLRSEFIVVVILATASVVFARPGDLDLTFSGDGKLTDLVPGLEWHSFAATVVQPDGKIIAVGNAGPTSYYVYVARYNTDGSPDATFGGTGKVAFQFGQQQNAVNDVALQPDGKIVLAGCFCDDNSSYYNLSLGRLNPDGSLDSSFGSNGIVNRPGAEANALAIQPDGKIVVASGYYGFSSRISRFNADGSPDASFDGDGYVETPDVREPIVLAIQADGKIVAVGKLNVANGHYFGVVRYNAIGSLDTSFDGDGIVSTSVSGGDDYVRDLLIQPDGKIVAAGCTSWLYDFACDQFALVRYNENGSLDTTFDGDGKVMTYLYGEFQPARIGSVAMQQNGKIVAGGSAANGLNGDFALVRYNPDGSLDLSFGGGDGKVTVDFDNSNDGASGMALDNAGRAVVIGESEDRFAIARFLLAPTSIPFDYDGDGKSDVSTFRPSDGVWHLNRSADGVAGVQWGSAADKIAPADYDGDGKTDVAVYRPSEGRWYLLNSSNGTFSTARWGVETDIPTPSDYDNDGRADVAVFRPSDGNWWVDRSTEGMLIYQFGASGDHPVVGDYDGDGRSDAAVFRPSSGVWYVFRSTAGVIGYQFGVGTDRVAPADYDGDGKTDIAVYRPSEGKWYIANSATATYPVHTFGAATDIPSPADYDGDGHADIAIFRPSDGNWWISRTTAGVIVQQFGQNGDKPTQNAFGN